MNEPLTARQLTLIIRQCVLVIFLCAALVGGFFFVRHAIRAHDSANREYNCALTAANPDLCQYER